MPSGAAPSAAMVMARASGRASGLIACSAKASATTSPSHWLLSRQTLSTNPSCRQDRIVRRHIAATASSTASPWGFRGVSVKG